MIIEINEIKVEVCSKGILICIKNNCELLNSNLKTIYKFEGESI